MPKMNKEFSFMNFSSPKEIKIQFKQPVFK